MIGLGGIRVIVVDNDDQDALWILKAFSMRGIPTAFFDGSRDMLPPCEQRLSGVRLAILDMDLLDGDTSDEGKASALVAYLQGIIAPHNGPYAALAWTQHSRLVDLFENYLFSVKELPNPIFTVTLAKSACKTATGFDLALVSAKLEERLGQASPLLFLQAWEEKCFGAATSVTNALSDLASKKSSALEKWRQVWSTELLILMRAMAKAEAEKHLDADTCLDSLYGLLNPLHADRMESQCVDLSRSLRAQVGDIMTASDQCDDEAIAKVNTMLHLSYENLERFRPGNILKLSRRRTPAWLPTVDQLVEALVKKEDQGGTSREALLKTSRTVVVEISPVCDHAQRNVRFARFITGLLVPKEQRNKMKPQGGFIKIEGPFFLNRGIRSGTYYFFFSARHVVSCDIKKLVKTKAWARLRSQSLGELRAWFTSHAARPGKVLLSRS